MFGKVAVLMGGKSSEREISLQTGTAILQALKNKGVEAVGIDVADDYIRRLTGENFSRAFIGLHGRGGEDGCIQGLLESIELPYTGTKVLGSALCMDKVRTKRIWQSVGLATAPFSIWNPDTPFEDYIKSFGLPLSVKPVFEGSSVGITKVTNLNGMQAACESASQYGQVMLEPWIIGDEYTVGILGDQALPTIQIVLPKGFYDYEAKYLSDETQYICPVSHLSSEEEHHLQQLALQAFHVLGGSGWGRVDLIRDVNRDFWLLEVNTVPGLTSHSLVPKAAEVIGLSFDDLILEILSQTLGKTSITSQGEQFKGEKV